MKNFKLLSVILFLSFAASAFGKGMLKNVLSRFGRSGVFNKRHLLAGAALATIGSATAENNKIPIIFHKNYDISFFGLERLHPFDGTKYGKVHQDIEVFLKRNKDQQEPGAKKLFFKKKNKKDNNFYMPNKASDNELLLAHTPRYLKSLKSSKTIEGIAELPGLSWIPNFLLQWYLLDPMRYATGGTILGAQLALEKGWAINLSGGYHHAKSDKQRGGFCFYADIPIAVKNLWKKKPNLKVLIVDLDAHQGNGHEEILGEDSRVAIFDVYNAGIYPGDYDNTRRFIDYNCPVRMGINSEDFLSIVRKNLPSAIRKHKPDLIIYNAGTDILVGDPVGKMNVAEEAIIERDAFVFDEAEKHETPILMVLSGGYTSKSAPVIGKSIKQILQKKGY